MDGNLITHIILANIYLRPSDDDSDTCEGGEIRTKDSNKIKSLGRNILEVEFTIKPYKENDYKGIRIEIRSSKDLW